MYLVRMPLGCTGGRHVIKIVLSLTANAFMADGWLGAVKFNIVITVPIYERLNVLFSMLYEVEVEKWMYCTISYDFK